MRMTRKGTNPLPKGCVKMAANKTAGKKEGKGSGEPFPNVEGNAGMDGEETANLSEEEIARYLTAQQRLERWRKMIEEEQKIAKEFEEKKKEARKTIFAEIERKYGLNERDIEKAFSEINNREAIIADIIATINEEGREALEKEDIKEKADILKMTYTIGKMDIKDIKKIALFSESARKYMEDMEAREGEKEIHHAGNMSEEALKLLCFVKEQGGRVTWTEFKRYGKEELHLDTDTLNKRRWGLITRGYLKREQGGRELVLTKAGMARLKEEGY